ncbi:helix-turn-helix domain-containing protein [Robinsoniella peoriensis]|uniref:helix-turn-helix domain-containing protein n=1 Tax=Robinsoniella peoriensis TaxID=180332 RepID=UPI003750D80B
MIHYWKEENVYIDGVPCQFLCHLETRNCAGIVYPAHYHDYIEMLYGLSGTFKVYLNGSYHSFTGGDLVLINSHEVHQIDSLSENGGEYIVVRFMPELIYNRMSQNHFELEYILPFITEDARHEKVIPYSEIRDTMLPTLFHNIMTENHERDYGYELAIKNHIGSIFLWILRYWHRSGEHPDNCRQPDRQLYEMLNPAFNYLSVNYEKPVKASEMAELCSLSSSYFSRSFNRLMGMSFNEYLNYIRVSEAEKLLISTPLSITEIAVTVGFSTSSYFIKIFKIYKNLSPKQFRMTLL